MSKSKAAHLLSHYFRLVFAAAGLKWDGDNNSEMYEIVEEIVEAATKKETDR